MTVTWHRERLIATQKIVDYRARLKEIDVITKEFRGDRPELFLSREESDALAVKWAAARAARRKSSSVCV